jgi:hypothetical protein
VLIAIGAQAAIPGIWFALQYAFVDAIATLDDKETDPRGRSRKLTASQRGKIFRTYMVFAGWIIGAFILHFILQGQSSVHVFAGGTMDGVVAILLAFSFVQFYLDMFRKPTSKSEPKEAPVEATPSVKGDSPIWGSLPGQPLDKGEGMPTDLSKKP